MLVDFSTVYHLMVVTIETDNQTGLCGHNSSIFIKMRFFYSVIGTVQFVLLCFLEDLQVSCKQTNYSGLYYPVLRSFNSLPNIARTYSA